MSITVDLLLLLINVDNEATSVVSMVNVTITTRATIITVHASHQGILPPKV
jgi:hypothetical protein